MKIKGRYGKILSYLYSEGYFRSGMSVVDCSCGNGRGSYLLMSHGCNVIGIDISEKCVNKTNDRGVLASQGDICDLDLDTDIADVFICSETLEHLDEKETLKAASEIKRIVKDEGLICITVPEDRDICLRNKLHKQFLTKSDLEDIFSPWICFHHDIYCKKPERCNRIMIFGKDNRQESSDTTLQA